MIKIEVDEHGYLMFHPKVEELVSFREVYEACSAGNFSYEACKKAALKHNGARNLEEIASGLFAYYEEER